MDESSSVGLVSAGEPLHLDQGRGNALTRFYPGVLAAGTIGLAAAWLSQHYGAPVTLFALLFGMAFHFLQEDGRCRPGVDLSSTVLLRTGVALLGTRITFAKIAGIGLFPILAVIAAVVTTMLFGMAMARMLGMRTRFGLLSGGAVGICGASAALAISSVLPRSEDRDRDTIVTVVIVTALSTLAMILYPVLVAHMGFDNVHSGIFLGGTIHDVAQVVGAGYGISPEIGDIATYVKLLRVSTLLPIIFGVALAVRIRHPSLAIATRPPLPLFLFGFAALVIVSSSGVLPPAAIDRLSDISRWCLVTAIAALGIKTSLGDVVAMGAKPVMLIIAETVWIATLMLGLMLYFR
jgi:uncharacterized integral membrane protein (TIGR00698 family)